MILAAYAHQRNVLKGGSKEDFVGGECNQKEIITINANWAAKRRMAMCQT
jgi:hypothetical protein